MALVMGAAMAIIMLAFMLGMYRNAKANLGIFAGSTPGIIQRSRPS